MITLNCKADFYPSNSALVADGRRGLDCSEVVAGEPVLAGGDAMKVFVPSEHLLDGLTAAVEYGREARLPRRLTFGGV